METVEQEQSRERSFETKKTVFFSRLAASVLSAMRMHKNPGLLLERPVDWKEKAELAQAKEEGKREKRSWGNVSEHQLVALARFDVLADKLGLSGNGKLNGRLGASTHDFNKRNEILAMKADLKSGGTGKEASDKTDQEGVQALREAGFSEEVIQIAGSVGGKTPTLKAMAGLLRQESLSETDLVRLVLHYVDGYTRDSAWADLAEQKDGATINEVDRRMQKNLDNPNYKKIDEEIRKELAGYPLLDGESGITGDGKINHLIEQRLAELIAERTGEKIDPLALPEVVDGEIRKKIEEVR